MKTEKAQLKRNDTDTMQSSKAPALTSTSFLMPFSFIWIEGEDQNYERTSFSLIRMLSEFVLILTRNLKSVRKKKSVLSEIRKLNAKFY